MLNRHYQDRFGDRRGYDRSSYQDRSRRVGRDRLRQSRGFIRQEEASAAHYSFYYDYTKGELLPLPLDEIVDSGPKTEIGFGHRDKLCDLVGTYEKKKQNSTSPFVTLLFWERNYLSFSKVYFNGCHEDINQDFIEYLNKIKQTLLDHMKQRSPSGNIKGIVSVHGSDDKAVLDTLRKYVRAKELVKYKI